MPKTAARNRIAEEHAALSALLKSIQRIEAPGRLAVELEKLQTLLREHFATEEAEDGLHAAVDRSAPHLLPAVQQLFDEHRQFLGDLEGLVETAQALSAGPMADLLRGVAELAARLHTHEVQETELFIDSVYTDLGAGD
jgi:hypothetical protein